jgi:HPt (histidine-containing phosphotransfer) domain-containing protein
VQDEQERALASARRLPPQALAGLREAFAEEVAERLPRLRAAVTTGDDVLLQHAVRDAHSLGSSAAVVGEADASRTARAAEALLVQRPTGGAVPPELVAHVDALSCVLAGWRP